MSSWDAKRQQKLNEEFENIFREHERLQQDLSTDRNDQYQPFLNSIDQWEQDAIEKIHKTAQTARNDLRRLFQTTNQQLQRTLTHTVTEELQQALQDKNAYAEFHIDKWLGSLSEIRRQLETIPSTVEFIDQKVLKLIKVKQIPFRADLTHREFHFEKIRGHPITYNTEHLISTARPAILLSQNKYSQGTHYFRFRIEQSTEQLFFGIISEKDIPMLKQNIHPVPSIHGWWNIDRRVLVGRKEPYVSALNIYNGDEIILIINCDARQIFLEYPSMTKLNSLRLVDKERESSLPWRLLIEIGKPGRCLIKLLDWGVTAHGTDRPDRRLHCFCSSD